MNQWPINGVPSTRLWRASTSHGMNSAIVSPGHVRCLRKVQYNSMYASTSQSAGYLSQPEQNLVVVHDIDIEVNSELRRPG